MPDQFVEVSLKEIVGVLEASAGNTDTDPRWLAAKELRKINQWEVRALTLKVNQP